MNQSDCFLDVAHRIGVRLGRQALWARDACTWKVMTVDRANPRSKGLVRSVAEGDIYQGTAGIALFLIELFRLTGEQEYAELADGAMRHALNKAHDLPDTNFAFYSGRVGIAYAAARVGRALEKAEYLKKAERIISVLQGNEQHDQGLDVIGGAAGAIPALLELANYLDPDLTVEMATALGDRLINAAHREAGGWAWGNSTQSHIRHLTGMAHGAAGVGHAFVTLHDHSGLGKFLYAAEQAFLYEQQFFDQETSNWLNLRHAELGEYVYEHRVEELQRRLRDGYKLRPFRTGCGYAWCHGAPGIGLTRTWAYQRLHTHAYADEARAAIRATTVSLDDRTMNYSLCHGAAGNCETLLSSAHVFDDATLRTRAELCGWEGWERYERGGQAWPCGTRDGVSDPSLLIGEAGIGYFYLRLASADTPSLLLLTPHPVRGTAPEPETSTYDELRDAHICSFFGRTLRVLDRLNTHDPVLDRINRASTTAHVVAAYDALGSRIKTEHDSSMQAQLEDVFSVERQRYEIAVSPIDFTKEFLLSLQQPELDAVEWETVTVRLTPGIHFVHNRWDWDGWLQEQSQNAATAGQYVHMVYQYRNAIRTRRLSPFAAVVLETARARSTVSQVVAEVKKAIPEIELDGLPALRQQVIAQLEQALRIGVVAIELNAQPAAASVGSG